MSLQWTAVAILLYSEIVVLTVFLLPWIRPPLWRKIFHSQLIQKGSRFFRTAAIVVGAILLFLFCDSLNESLKFASLDMSLVQNQSKVSRAFRAQRNLYLTGFAVFLAIIIKRMANLLEREAELMEEACRAIDVARSTADRAAERLAYPLTVEDQRNKGACEMLKSQAETLQQRIEDLKEEKDEIRSASERLSEEYSTLLTKRSSITAKN